MGKGRKVALLVGVGNYGNGLKSLQCPAHGVNELTAILKQPEIGAFDDVVDLIDPDVGTMRSSIGEVFSRLTKHDLVLFYFTGHGIKDMTGEFYLTTSQTQLFDNGRPNPGTAVEASFVKTVLGNCYAQRKVIILDCCFGAAFADGFLAMDDGSVDVQADLGGEGWVVLTAATARNYALEQEGEALSVYTRYLVEGLKTGAAAQAGQEYVSVRQLHSYVRGKVETAAPTMEPAIFNRYEGEDIWLARAVINPETTYRQKVQSKIRRGRIAPAGKRFLDIWAIRLNISPDRSAEIEADVLRPFAEKQRHLDLYTETLQEEIAEEFPLSQETIEDLKDLQRLWNLRDEDVKPIIINAGHKIKEDGLCSDFFPSTTVEFSLKNEYQLNNTKFSERIDNKNSFSLTSSLLWKESQSLWKEIVRNISSKGIQLILLKQTCLIQLQSGIAHIGYLDKDCLSTLIQFEEIIKQSIYNSCGKDVHVNFEISQKLTLDNYLKDLDSLWHGVVGHIQLLGSRALFSQQGWLIDYDEVSAVIGFSSEHFLKQAQRKSNDVEMAFEKVTGHHVDTTFEIAKPLKPAQIEQDIWQEALEVLQPTGTKALFINQASLADFDGITARVLIENLSLFKMAVSRTENLRIALRKILEYPVSVNIEIAKTTDR
ncbi:MAG: caspase family protein [Cyanobacteria bacterium P01_F01_bin.56]